MTERDRILAELCKQFPHASDRKLAQRLHEQHRAMFPTLNTADCFLRKARGARGNRNRKSTKNKELFRPLRNSGDIPALPESEIADWTPVVLDNPGKVLSLSDLHFRFHHKQAIEAALKYADKFVPNTILINGDAFDFYQISKFDKDPTKGKLQAELACGREFFTHLRKRFRKARIVFRYGNHDRRWDIYLMRCAPLLWEAVPKLQDVWHADAGIPENGIEVIRHKCRVMLGKLPVLHGDELPRGISSPVNAARGVFLKTLEPTLAAHFHQQSEQPAKDGSGKQMFAWTQGCLCGLSPEYAPINQWTHGFATIEVERGGNYHVRLHRIIDGQIY